MKDNQKLEKHFGLHQIKPVMRFEHKGVDIYIGEGGPFFDYPKDRDDSHKFSLGYYESVYAIGKNEKVDFYQVLIFEYLHDIEQTENARKQGRINAAVNAGKITVDTAIGVLNAH